jgi:hypothetical protein
MSEIQSNLIPGSIWNRQKKNGVAKNTVLLVTNEGCSEKILAAHPQQVVFLTESYQVLSMSVNDFLQGRVYAGLEATVAATVELLTTEQEGPLDDVEIEDVAIESSLFDSMLETVETDDDIEEVPTEVGADNLSATLGLSVGAHSLAPALESSLIAYSEAPYHTGDTLHILRFTLDNGLTIKDVAQAFTLTDPNAIQSFEVKTNREILNVVIDSYVDTMYEANAFEDCITLYVLSAGMYRDNTPAVQEEPEEVILHDDPVTEVAADAIIDLNSPTITISVS